LFIRYLLYLRLVDKVGYLMIFFHAQLD